MAFNSKYTGQQVESILDSAKEQIPQLAAILTLAITSGNNSKITDSEEWEYVLLDAADKIIMGVRYDNSVYVGTDLEEILTYITPPNLCIIDIINNFSNYYTKLETYSQEEIGKLATILALGCASTSINKTSDAEYKIVLIDNQNHILLGVKQDNSWDLNDNDLDDILDTIVSTYQGSGTFANKPSSPYVGEQYFCTDKQTTEGSTNGIPIWYNGTNWVDALGRTIS